jgi:tetratricopeptide (TPR) repeat protein
LAESRIADLRRRLERDPESRLFAQLAEELRKGGELEEAIGVARAGLARHPAYPSARLTLGRALLDSGDPAGARVELEAAVQGAPDNILASRLLGEALETLGDLGSALEQYARTLQMAPGDAHVEARIEAIQGRLGATDASGGERPVMPGPGAAPGGTAGEDDEEGQLPPTIRIRMPGDAPPGARAPLPPVPSADAGGEVTQPQRTPGAEGGSGAGTEAQAAGSGLPVTLPMPRVERAKATQGAAEGRTEGTTEMPAEVPGGEPDAEAVPSDLAPTLPKSRAAEFASAAGGVPPTLPPGRVTRGMSAADAGPAEAFGSRPGEGDEPPVGAPAARPIPGAESAPLSSATLAELYFEQGLLERAVEVYRQVLQEEPGNAGARRRLAEIEKLVIRGAAELSVPAPELGDDPAARRRALERTIERLEGLLEVVRRR